MASMFRFNEHQTLEIVQYLSYSDLQANNLNLEHAVGILLNIHTHSPSTTPCALIPLINSG